MDLLASVSTGVVRIQSMTVVLLRAPHRGAITERATPSNGPLISAFQWNARPRCYWPRAGVAAVVIFQSQVSGITYHVVFECTLFCSFSRTKIFCHLLGIIHTRSCERVSLQTAHNNNVNGNSLTFCPWAVSNWCYKALGCITPVSRRLFLVQENLTFCEQKWEPQTQNWKGLSGDNLRLSPEEWQAVIGATKSLECTRCFTFNPDHNIIYPLGILSWATCIVYRTA